VLGGFVCFSVPQFVFREGFYYLDVFFVDCGQETTVSAFFMVCIVEGKDVSYAFRVAMGWIVEAFACRGFFYGFDCTFRKCVEHIQILCNIVGVDPGKKFAFSEYEIQDDTFFCAVLI